MSNIEEQQQKENSNCQIKEKGTEPHLNDHQQVEEQLANKSECAAMVSKNQDESKLPPESNDDDNHRLEEYSDSAELDDETEEEYIEIRPSCEYQELGEKAFEEGDYERAIEYASKALRMGTSEKGDDELDPSLAELYMNYGNYLLVNYEQSSDVLSGAQPAKSQSKIQELISQQIDEADGGDDVLAFEMLEVAKKLFEVQYRKLFPDSPALTSASSVDTIADFSFVDRIEISNNMTTERLSEEQQQVVLHRAYVHRRLGDLYLAQDIHASGLQELLIGFLFLHHHYEQYQLNPVHMRQLSILLAQSLQWTGHLEKAQQIYSFALRLYHCISNLDPNSESATLAKINEATIQSSKDTIEDLEVILSDIKKIIQSREASDTKIHKSPTGSPKADREQALLNSVPSGALDDMEGTKNEFDKSKFDEKEIKEVSPVRRKRPIEFTATRSEAKKPKTE